MRLMHAGMSTLGRFLRTPKAPLRRCFSEFARAYRWLLAEVDELRSACVNSISGKLPDLAEQFQSYEQLLHDDFMLPFVYMDISTIRIGCFSDTQKAAALDIQQDILALLKNLRTAHSLLEDVRDDDLASSQATLDELKLCREICLFHFRLGSMLNKYDGLLQEISRAKQLPTVRDLSSQASNLLIEIREAQRDGEPEVKRIDCSKMGANVAVQFIQDNLQRNQYKQALGLLRAFRREWPDDVFGSTASDDTHVLLDISARVVAGKHRNAMILTICDPSVASTAQALTKSSMRHLAIVQKRIRAFDSL
eukprot:m.93294 g.93294  ORF g.93294 m.93294 type:complete len:308 (+) comp8680_c0_seq1:7573-8496(+)